MIMFVIRSVLFLPSLAKESVSSHIQTLTMVAGLFHRKSSREEAAPVYTANDAAVSDGSLQYVVEKTGNTTEVSYQEASGAPVESDSPLGYSVGAITIIFLNLSKMIGTGIYSTREFSLRYGRTTQ